MTTGLHAAFSAYDAWLPIDDPRVLGSMAAFVFIIFVAEVVVSGKAYKRVVAENAKLRRQNAEMLPVVEEMVETMKRALRVTENSTDVSEALLAYWKDEPYKRRGARL